MSQSQQEQKELQSVFANNGNGKPIVHFHPGSHKAIMGGGHTRLRERGERAPIPTRVKYTVVLFIYTYFVGGRKPPTHRQRRQKDSQGRSTEARMKKTAMSYTTL